jgi:hypothetical protein
MAGRVRQNRMNDGFVGAEVELRGWKPVMAHFPLHCVCFPHSSFSSASSAEFAMSSGMARLAPVEVALIAHSYPPHPLSPSVAAAVVY